MHSVCHTCMADIYSDGTEDVGVGLFSVRRLDYLQTSRLPASPCQALSVGQWRLFIGPGRLSTHW